MPAAALEDPHDRPISLHRKYVESDAVGAKITELYAHISAATYRFLTLVAEFDENGYWELPGLNSCAHWLNWQCGIGMNAAREKVRVARALRGLPKISAAFARGELSYSKVRAITRAANPDNEDYLLHFAQHGTAYHVERLIAGFRLVNRLEKAGLEQQPQALREVKTRWDGDGCLVVTARLPAEQGAMLQKALELAVDRAGERALTAAREVTGEAPAVYGAQDVSAETLLEEKEPIAARRADALVELAEHYLNSEAPSGSAGDRYQVVVHVSAETRAIKELDLPRIDSGPGVSAETSRRLACDCAFVPVFKGIRGEPLSVGRRTRAIPPAIMRALRIRDGGCRFPGCTNGRFVDGHHIKHWADGGETSLDNLVLLCRRHHHLVHEGGFGCEQSRNGGVIFKSPRGNVIPPAFGMTAPPSVHEPVAWMAEQVDCDHIDATTCVTKWAGEQCDWDLAVGHLFTHIPLQYAGLRSSANPADSFLS